MTTRICHGFRTLHKLLACFALLCCCLPVTAEEVRWLTEPVTIRPSELRDATRFVVERDFGDLYAVTLEGNWKPRENPESEDRHDGPFPAITVDCGYQSRGIRLYRIDNASIGELIVLESRGEALEICQLRQSRLESVRCHRCQSDRSIVRFAAVPGAYSTNMLDCGQFVVMACDAPVTIAFDNCEDSANRLRLITFSQLICHPAWTPAAKQFPRLAEFRPRKRVHVDFQNAEHVTVSSYNMRLDPHDHDGSMAFQVSPKARGIVAVNGQILRRRNEDWRKFVSKSVTILRPTEVGP
jgi:hypothetical protein